MIFFPVVDQTEKNHRDAIARLFPVDQTEKYEREPISSSLIDERHDLERAHKGWMQKINLWFLHVQQLIPRTKKNNLKTSIPHCFFSPFKSRKLQNAKGILKLKWIIIKQHTYLLNKSTVETQRNKKSDDHKSRGSISSACQCRWRNNKMEKRSRYPLITTAAAAMAM